MKIAVISDPHGNIHALKAVLADSQRQGAALHLFLGDYFTELPFPNEVAALVRGTPNTHAVAGNKEGYLHNVLASPPQARANLQFAPVYWNYDQLTAENRQWLLDLPQTAQISACGQPLFLAHAPGQHFGPSPLDKIGGRGFDVLYRQGAYSYQDYVSRTRKTVQQDPTFAKALAALPDGVYLYGHYHVQWHTRLDGKLLVNPGACGMPLDGTPGAPYTLLEWDAAGADWLVEERRVTYDEEAAMESLRDSTLFTASPIWAEIALYQLRHHRVKALYFLDYVEHLAQQQGDDARPYSNEIWQEAALRFRL